MSWLARSLVNSLHNDDEGEEIERDCIIRQKRDDDFGNNEISRHNQSSFSMHDVSQRNRQREEREDGEDDHSRGVKEDLTELRQTLTRQLRGVASFLAPRPPPPPPCPPSNSVPRSPDHRLDQRSVDDCGRLGSSDPSVSGDDDESSFHDQIAVISGERPKVGEVAVGVTSGVSNDRAVSEACGRSISKGEERDWVHEVVGLTDEVLAFAGNIAHHPETWLDYPIEEEDDLEDFNMSECQKEHVMAIEHLTPSLRALRIEFCPVHMSEGYFWKVYFVLLHSRLSKHDADLLSTSQVVEARAKWMKELQKRTKEEMERHHHKESAYLQHDDCPTSPQIWALKSMPQHWTFTSGPAYSTSTGDSDTERHPIISSKAQIIDNSVEEEKLVNKAVDRNYSAGPLPKAPHYNFGDDNDDDDDDDDDKDDDDYDWLEDDFSLHGKNAISIPVGIEEDVTFSDLEDDDCSLHTKYKIGTKD